MADESGSQAEASTTPPTAEQPGIGRRQLLGKAAVGVGVAWVAPTMVSLPASAEGLLRSPAPKPPPKEPWTGEPWTKDPDWKPEPWTKDPTWQAEPWQKGTN